MEMIVDKIEPAMTEIVVISYDGDYDDVSGLFHGQGTATLDNGCVYEGSFINGLFHGKGIFSWPDGVKYEGDFAIGNLCGKGQFLWPDGSMYLGEILDGKRNGAGKFMGSNGQVYEGDWSNGTRSGGGKVWFNEDKTCSYMGDWKLNQRHGYGIMKYPSGNWYEGEWRQDKKCGYGVMVWKDIDEVYCGQWQDGQPNGYGEHIWGENGSKSIKKQVCNLYRGFFLDSKRSGRGTFFYMNGSQYSGEWCNDKKHGDGVFINSNGDVFAGEFDDNRMKFLAGSKDVQQRATEDVNTQYCLLGIRDVVERIPAFLDDSSVAAEVREVERIMLKFNSYVKLAYRRYTELSVKRRSRDHVVHSSGNVSLFLATQQKMMDSVSKVEKAMVTARNFHKRLHCLSLEQTLRFLREINLVGPYFRSYDLGQCLRQMRNAHEAAAAAMLLKYKQDSLIAAGGSLSDEAAESVEHLKIDRLFDSYLEPRAADANFDIWMAQPLFEREFVEVLVRAVAVYRENRFGVQHEASLANFLYQQFAEKLLPSTQDWEGHTSPYFRAFYADAVQELFANHCVDIATAIGTVKASPFEQLWMQMLELEAQPLERNARGGAVRLKTLLQFLLKDGVMIKDGTAATELLCALHCIECPALESIVHGRIDFDDFLELFCRAVLSGLWVFGVSSPSEEIKTEDSNILAADSTDLCEKLRYWCAHFFA